MAKIAIITTSTRTPRIGPQVTEVVKEILQPLAAQKNHELGVLDVADFNLPIFNEKLLPAMVPAQGEFEFEHSKRWSAAIAEYDAYIITAPEYNFGIPGSTKNAIDYLYNAWIGKPIAIVTYGIFGGQKSNEALKTTLNGMKLRVAETRPTLSFNGGVGPSMYAAVGGQLDEPTKADWKADTTSLASAYAELTTLLETPPEVAAATTKA